MTGKVSGKKRSFYGIISRCGGTRGRTTSRRRRRRKNDEPKCVVEVTKTDALKRFPAKNE